MEPAARFRIGTVECTIVSDGWNDYQPATIFPGIPEEDWRALVGDSLTHDGLVRTPYQVLLLSVGDRWVLVDAGLGEVAGPDGTAGRVRASLAAMGVAADEIEAVIVSHGHPDHIGGLVRLGDASPAPAFPNATVLLTREEHDFWTTDAS